MKLVEASTLDSVVADDSSGDEQTAENGNLVEADQVEDQAAVVSEENAYDQTGDNNYVQSAQGMDHTGSVSEESFDDDQEEVDRSDSIVEDQVESESLIDKVIEERMEQLEISRKADKNAEKKQVSLKPLELAEELEKKQASFGQHWEEGAAAQPMQLEGIGKGPPAIGYMQIEMDNPVTRAMSSPSFRPDHGSPQVLAVHRSYIAMGTSKGAVIVIPSKYSIHQADDTDAKMLFFWNQGEKTQSPVTAMCFNQQGDLLLVGYGDGHMTIWDVQKATAAKVIYGEHTAPVVHVCFIRQSKAITGDSKGVVLLHTFSIIPVINRLTIKGTQRLFDGNTGIVLSACPLLVDESFGFSNSSSQGNQTTSSSGGGLGSMMGGVVGGVVGVDSGWKFFNESSTVEDGVVVMFIMHQHALVVRLRTNIDHVDHIETFSRPDGAREGSIAYAAWKYTSSLNDSSSLDEERVSWLALAWDRQVQVAKFVKSKIVKHKEWKLDSAAIGVAWLDDQMLVVLNLRGQLCLFSKDGSELRRTTFVPDGLLFDNTILHHAHFSNRFGNPERHFNSSVAVRGATVYILGPTFLTVSRLLPWKERIEALKRAGDWMGALDMAMRLYDGQTQGVVDLPRTVDSIRESIMPYLVELLLSYISYVFEYISIALSNHTGKGGDSDVLIEADRSLLTQREEQYARVGGVAVEYCVHIGRNDILFDTVFSKFVAAQSRGMFLEVLEPYILKDMLGSLPPEIMQALVEHYSGKGWLQRVEQCILHMDISSLDFNQVVRLCREHGLYGALIYLFNQGLNDQGRRWNGTNFASLRAPYQYSLPRDTANLFFHTRVQEDAFFGHLLKKNVFKHQKIDFNYMATQPVMVGVVNNFVNIELRDFLENHCDWNETIIRQFYATVEIDMTEKSLEWMTGKRRYQATFAEFAAANEINYESITDDTSYNVLDENFFELHDITGFYEPNRTGIARVYTTITGLRHHPAVINKIIRATILPKSGYKEKFGGWASNIVHHVMSNHKFDVVNLIMWQILEKKTNIEFNLYFAPYIMALILTKTKFKGQCNERHLVYKPFRNDSTFLARPLTPYLEGDDNEAYVNAEVGAAAAAGGAAPEDAENPQTEDADAQAMPPPPPPEPQQHQWAPPAGYFDPYFATLQQSMTSQFEQMQLGYTSHFEAFGQQMHNSFQTMQQGFQQQLDTRLTQFGTHFQQNVYTSMMNRMTTMSNNLDSAIDALNERFDGITTHEEFQTVIERQEHLQQDFEAFRGHFHSYFPAPAPPPEFYPHQPYHPPPPPPEQ
ncbi:unnamed protein product [Urochloa decumbens]|uniref:Vacuolar protein sorting-associated protein 8 central domain-containing protein n=1 Tax=Urochloa decumbens TaxID=240449 RepID=A0ABC8VI85_9POAL